MPRERYTGDAAQDQRLALERLIERRSEALNASLGLEVTSRVITPTNPMVGGMDAVQEQFFATGYDGAETTLALTFGISAFGGPDLFTD